MPVVVGQVEVAGGVVGAGEAVVGVGFFVAITDLGGQRECGSVLGACLVKLSVGVVGLAEAVQDLSFDGPITGVAADREGLLVVLGGLLVTALPPMEGSDGDCCIGRRRRSGNRAVCSRRRSLNSPSPSDPGHQSAVQSDHP